MSARKASSRRQPALSLRNLMQLIGWFRGGRLTLALAAFVLVAFFGLWCAAWHGIGRQAMSSDDYWLTQEDVEITPPKAWIHSDLRGEVFRDASLDEPLWLMDDDLTTRIANAFSLHPWVARVRRVTKHHPARVRVELEYRRPVCMVQVSGELLPVDTDGVLLPRRDFSPIEARQYPRLEGVDTAPIGPVGTHWGDAKVLGGAEIAAAFGPAWQELGLESIVPTAPVRVGHGDEYTYELVTRGGTRILWGHPPGIEIPGDVPAADKVAWLVGYHRENGTLEGRDGPQRIDIRSLPPASRAAARPKDAAT